jgi:hypothetical protein
MVACVRWLRVWWLRALWLFFSSHFHVKIARARARGVKLPNSPANGKFHHRNLSTSSVSPISPHPYNTTTSHVTRSLSHSHSHPVLAISRPHSQPTRHSPLSNQPTSPRSSPRASHAASAPQSPKSPHSPKSPRSPHSSRATTTSTTTTSSSASSSSSSSSSSSASASSSSNRSPTTKPPNFGISDLHKGGEGEKQFKETLAQMEQLLRMKDEELARLREEISVLTSGKQKTSTVSYLDFLPPPINKRK